MSQSAASTALKELEEGLQLQLFHRGGKQIVLNENGRRIQPVVRSLLTQVRDLEYNGPSLAVNGTLRIGTSSTVGNYVLGPICAAFARRYPEVRIKLDVLPSREVIQDVASMKYDLGIIETPCNRVTLISEALCEDELIIFGARNHPLAEAEHVTMADLRGARWCLGNTNSHTRQMLTLSLAQSGLAIVLESNSMAAIKMAVAAGIGLGCLSRLAIVPELTNGLLVPIRVEGFALKRIFNLITPANIYKGVVQEAFASTARSVLTSFR